MTRFLKIIPRPCCEQFHVRTVFFLLNYTRLYHCTDGNVHLLMNKDRVGCKGRNTVDASSQTFQATPDWPHASLRFECQVKIVTQAQAHSEHRSPGAPKLETQKLNPSVWVHFRSRQPQVTSFQTLAEHVHTHRHICDTLSPLLFSLSSPTFLHTQQVCLLLWSWQHSE